MKFLPSASYHIAIVLLVCLNYVHSQLTAHQMRLFSPGKPVITTGPATYDSIVNTDAQLRDVGTRFTNVAAICASGMWALYNTTNYGEGFESVTSVTTIRGYDSGACASSSTFPAFKSVRSIQFLGHINPTMNGLYIYSGYATTNEFYGLAVKMITLPTPGAVPMPVGGPINAIRLGSLAITGTGLWRLCSDLNTCVCIDMTRQRGNMYMSRNVFADKSTPWPFFVRYIGTATDSTSCQSDSNPPGVTGKSISRYLVDDHILHVE